MQNFIYFFAHIDDDRKAVSDLVFVFPFLNAIDDDFLDNYDQVHHFLGHAVRILLGDGADQPNDVVLAFVVVYFFEVETQHLHAPSLNIMILQQLIDDGDDLARVLLLDLYQFG
jgi:hypothetical protein